MPERRSTDRINRFDPLPARLDEAPEVTGADTPHS